MLCGCHSPWAWRCGEAAAFAVGQGEDIDSLGLLPREGEVAPHGNPGDNKLVIMMTVAPCIFSHSFARGICCQRTIQGQGQGEVREGQVPASGEWTSRAKHNLWELLCSMLAALEQLPH
jgi:hypothetical protein